MSMNIEVARILSDMRQLREMAVQNDVLPNNLNQGVQGATGQVENVPEFGQLFGQAIDQVNETRQEAASLRTAFQQGEPGVDLTSVMVAAQKASLATEAVIQVRNKFVQAYEEIMKMPV